MNIQYRKAEREDFPKVAALFIEMLQTIYQKEDVEGYEEGYLDRFVESKEDWIIVAEENEEVVAFLSIEVHHEPKDYIYLDDFSVTTDYRGCGIGTKMLKQAEEYGKSLQLPSMFLHVEKENKKAYQLYTRIGYQIYEDQGNRLLMTKSIAD